jgi:hypothetical protein
VAIVKQDKNRMVRLRYNTIQKGWSKDTAPAKVVIVYQGRPLEMAFGEESEVMMPFRIAQHYLAKQKNWGTGRGEGNGAVLDIVELQAVRNPVRNNAPAEFDIETASYDALKEKAVEVGLEFAGNISKAALKTQLAEALAKLD